jgi:hypothetical protein
MLLYRYSYPVFCKEGDSGYPRFPGNPHVHLPGAQTPPGLPRQTFTAFPYCPRYFEGEGSKNRIHFEAQCHGFCTYCLRFVPPLLTTTQDSLRDTALVVSLYRMGVVTHRVSMKSFNALPERGASPLPGLTWRDKRQMTKTVNPWRQFAFVWDFEPLYLGFVSDFVLRIYSLPSF